MLGPDIKGMSFGRWFVIRREKSTAIRGARWLCRCLCGTQRIVLAGVLKSGHSKSCGCLKQDMFCSYVAKKIKTIVGSKFGYFTIISAPERRVGAYKVTCKCNCGVVKKVYANSLLSGTSKSCGCFSRSLTRELGRSRLINLVGKRFHRLVVIDRSLRVSGNNAVWLCRCDCGTLRHVNSNSLRRGLTKSCGCLVKEAPWFDGLKTRNIYRSLNVISASTDGRRIRKYLKRNFDIRLIEMMIIKNQLGRKIGEYERKQISNDK